MVEMAVMCTNIGAYADVLELQTVPASPAPQEGEILVDVLACGIAFPDVLTVMGKHISKPTPPFALGNEVAGRVKKVGAGVTTFKVGDYCFGTSMTGGARSEAILGAAHVYNMPEGVDPIKAAGFELNYGRIGPGLWHSTARQGRAGQGRAG